ALYDKRRRLSPNWSSTFAGSTEYASCNRVYYLAIPPSLFMHVATHLKSDRFAPLARSCRQHLSNLFTEDQVYRIDHFIWARRWSQNVVENFGTEGRGGYFDENSALFETSRCVNGCRCMIRDEKVKVLRSIRPIELKRHPSSSGNTLANSETGKPGYLDDATLYQPGRWRPPTAWRRCTLRTNGGTTEFHSLSESWQKALNETKCERRYIRVWCSANRNELVMRVQPNEAVYIKCMTKRPGMGFGAEETELDLSYSKRFSKVKLPGCLRTIAIGCTVRISGAFVNFVRTTDELRAKAWRIHITPTILHELDAKAVKPLPYAYGARNGPPEADQFLREICGFTFSGTSALTRGVSRIQLQ
uniref:glucose-6-phosphate dehydrogenase (NADP(+)) n=1 Tax=Macrostomum lignano TaxID=282301 RepID=A0A1I8FGS8_9PLAT